MCDLFFKLWPSYFKCDPFFQVLPFLCVTHFSECNFFKSYRLFLNVTYFTKCEPCLFVWLIFFKSDLLCQASPMFWRVTHVFTCDSFFQVRSIFPSVIQFYKSKPFFSSLTYFSKWDLSFKGDPFFQAWPIFLSLTDFSECYSLFQVGAIFQKVIHFYNCDNDDCLIFTTVTTTSASSPLNLYVANVTQ